MYECIIVLSIISHRSVGVGPPITAYRGTLPVTHGIAAIILSGLPTR